MSTQNAIKGLENGIKRLGHKVVNIKQVYSLDPEVMAIMVASPKRGAASTPIQVPAIFANGNFPPEYYTQHGYAPRPEGTTQFMVVPSKKERSGYKAVYMQY